MTTLELTPDLERRIREHSPCSFTKCILHELARLLPPEPVDPRTMVAGPEMDTALCKAMGAHLKTVAQGEGRCLGLNGRWRFDGCFPWSTDERGLGIGPMLNKLTEWGYQRGVGSSAGRTVRHESCKAWASIHPKFEAAFGATDSEAVGKLLLAAERSKS